MANELLPTGIYRHFKGNEYAVIGVARQSETREKLVIYRALDSGKMWARPLEMFREKVELAGKQVWRFERVRRQEGNARK